MKTYFQGVSARATGRKDESATHSYHSDYLMKTIISTDVVFRFYLYYLSMDYNKLFVR